MAVHPQVRTDAAGHQKRPVAARPSNLPPTNTDGSSFANAPSTATRTPMSISVHAPDQRNPVAHLTRDERPSTSDQARTPAFTRKQLAQLFAASDPENRLLCRVLAGTGLRIGEALGLEWRHIDWKNGVLRVDQQATPDGRLKRPKTARAMRDVPLDHVVAGDLRRHRLASRYSRDGDPVFASNTGTVLRVHNLRERSFRPLLERLGWAKQGFGLHSFRRSYVSALIANGLDVANVSKYAGHASPTITLDRYAREFEARKRDDDRVREVTAGLWSATSEQ